MCIVDIIRIAVTLHMLLDERILAKIIDCYGNTRSFETGYVWMPRMLLLMLVY